MYGGTTERKRRSPLSELIYVQERQTVIPTVWAMDTCGWGFGFCVILTFVCVVCQRLVGIRDCMIIFSGNALLQLTNGLHVYFGFMMGMGSLGLNESGDDGDT